MNTLKWRENRLMMRKNNTLKWVTITLLASVSVATLTGCSNSNEPVKAKQVAEQAINKDGTTEDKNGVEAISPQIIILDHSLEGQQIQVNPKSNVILASVDPEAWTGSVADTAIATFIPGKKNDDYTTNASLQVHRDGETEVTVTNKGKSYTFKIISVYTEDPTQEVTEGEEVEEEGVMAENTPETVSETPATEE